MSQKAPLLPGDSTVSGSSNHDPGRGDEAESTVPVLVLIWSQDEPDRIGELVSPPRSRGLVFTLGRAVESGDDALPLTFTRLRPFSCEDTGPLQAPRVSRRQLRLRGAGDDGFVVEREARARLRVNGHEVDSAVVGPGDVIEVERRFMLLVGERPRSWPRRRRSERVPDFPFGQADGDGIVGESPATWELRERVRALASRAEHVLISGPSGCGKELIARSLHGNSRRSAARWVARNAATFPDALIDAELFGNLKNYLNPGTPEREGLVGAADGSTLFLDEIGELSQASQASLLRVLDRGEYQRLGESQIRRTDMRVLAATNREPRQLKHDLLARFEHRLIVPGLDERLDDVPLIARHLARTFAARGAPGGPEPVLDAELIHGLVARRWTTHVRELSEILLRALTRGDGLRLRAPPDLVADPRPRPDIEPVDPGLLSREQVLEALARCDNVREQAWRALGLRNRYQFRRVLRRLAIE